MRPSHDKQRGFRHPVRRISWTGPEAKLRKVVEEDNQCPRDNGRWAPIVVFLFLLSFYFLPSIFFSLFYLFSSSFFRIRILNLAPNMQHFKISNMVQNYILFVILLRQTLKVCNLHKIVLRYFKKSLVHKVLWRDLVNTHFYRKTNII
jgi:hypothetical protein